MPNIDLDQLLKNKQGVELLDNGKPIELGSSLLYALATRLEGQSNEVSLACYNLHKKLFNGGVVFLSAEEVLLLKHRCVNFIESSFVAIVDILEA